MVGAVRVRLPVQRPRSLRHLRGVNRAQDAELRPVLARQSRPPLPAQPQRSLGHLAGLAGLFPEKENLVRHPGRRTVDGVPGHKLLGRVLWIHGQVQFAGRDYHSLLVLYCVRIVLDTVPQLISRTRDLRLAHSSRAHVARRWRRLISDCGPAGVAPAPCADNIVWSAVRRYCNNVQRGPAVLQISI